MARGYVSAKKEMAYGHTHSALLIIGILVVFAFIGFFIMSTHNQLREDLIETLKKDKEVMETNSRLKTELAGITQARFMELKAKERLGLKKPKEEEVLVLR
ncbi:MAG: hypothetical protein C0399_01905 [Syntrophus sp. (in: bacteria)]|nr:hypothetical protein [Syntrophus sp. (in: bacteria)]